MRFLARETLAALRVRLTYFCSRASSTFVQEKFPKAPEEVYASCIGRLIYYRSINPAIMLVQLITPLCSSR